MSVRSDLRVVVFEWAQNRCEHPIDDLVDAPHARFVAPVRYRRCGHSAVELAHLYPRGMGHTGYRDTLDNVIAACTLHARSTDDLSSDEWGHVPAPSDRKALYEWIQQRRRSEGWPSEMETG